MIKWNKTAYITLAVMATVIVVTVIVTDAIMYGTPAISSIALLVPMVVGFISKIDEKGGKIK